MGYDIIGDIHGHAHALEVLLTDMGYRKESGTWRPPSGRTAIFVGDYIDRGPQQVESVNIVRRMVDGGHARAIMGNHEFNAIGWTTEDPDKPGQRLRPHSEHNLKQHSAFLAEVENTPKHKEILDWFMTLPLWLELDGIRIVHACWHQDYMDYLVPKLAAGNRLDRELLIEASRKPSREEKENSGTTPFKAVEALCKGIEARLPDGHTFFDKEKKERDEVRTRWWDSNATTYRQAALLDEERLKSIPDHPLPQHARVPLVGAEPVFFGHYWWSGEPEVLAAGRAACVDYSVALPGGKLVAYRWDGESTLSSSKFHWLRPWPQPCALERAEFGGDPFPIAYLPQAATSSA
jgi:hypothetical protein